MTKGFYRYPWRVCLPAASPHRRAGKDRKLETSDTMIRRAMRDPVVRAQQAPAGKPTRRTRSCCSCTARPTGGNRVRSSDRGVSMMDLIAARGYDVYLVDVRGYGRSTRPPK